MNNGNSTVIHDVGAFRTSLVGRYHNQYSYEPHLMKSKVQTSIATLLSTTAIAAIWFGLYRFAPDAAWLLVGIVGFGSYSIYTRKLSRLFWLPFILCINWILLSLTSWWLPVEIVFLIGLVLVSLVATTTFAIIRTRQMASNYKSRDGVIFVGWSQSSLAGFLVGLSIALPIFVAGIFPLSPIPRFFIDGGIGLIIALPIGGLFAGMALGVILGFVCDIIVGLDFKKRSRTQKMGQRQSPSCDGSLNKND